MAAKTPVRFKRTAEAFEVVGRSKGFPVISSSGSEHSPDDDLFDRVNSFIERDDYSELPVNYYEEEGNSEFCPELNNARDLLSKLLSSENGGDDDLVRENLSVETEKAYGFAGEKFSPEFKRRLTFQLRERGFDAGLCKSKWEKMGQISSGNYEYIDVNVVGTRYIIEVSLADQFEIARPSKTYTSILELIPPIFVGKIEELKQIVKIMCKAIKISLKNVEMHVPPWRRYRYVKAKWSNSYERTVNEILEKKLEDSDQVSAKKRALVGFSPLPNEVLEKKFEDLDQGSAKKRALIGFSPLLPVTRSYYCRENFVSKVRLRVGYLALAVDGI